MLWNLTEIFLKSAYFAQSLWNIFKRRKILDNKRYFNFPIITIENKILFLVMIEYLLLNWLSYYNP